MTPFANPLIRAVKPATVITNITNAYPAVITTSAPHGYADGIFATIVIPYPKVMTQINGKTYLFFVLSPTQLIPVIAFAFNGSSVSATFLDTRNIGPFSLGPLATCTIPQPQPLPPLPPIPPMPPVTFTVPAQQAQLVPNGEFAVLTNVSDIIGPNNPPIPFPGN